MKKKNIIFYFYFNLFVGTRINLSLFNTYLPMMNVTQLEGLQKKQKTSRYNFISEISSNFVIPLKNSLIILIAFYFLCWFSSMCLLLSSQIPSYRRLIFYFTTTALTRSECSFILSLLIFFRQEEHQSYSFRPIAKTFKFVITANQFTILHIKEYIMSYKKRDKCKKYKQEMCFSLSFHNINSHQFTIPDRRVFYCIRSHSLLL